MEEKESIIEMLQPQEGNIWKKAIAKADIEEIKSVEKHIGVKFPDEYDYFFNMLMGAHCMVTRLQSGSLTLWS